MKYRIKWKWIQRNAMLIYFIVLRLRHEYGHRYYIDVIILSKSEKFKCDFLFNCWQIDFGIRNFNHKYWNILYLILKPSSVRNSTKRYQITWNTIIYLYKKQFSKTMKRRVWNILDIVLINIVKSDLLKSA